MLCPSLYHRVTSHVPSGGNRSAILTGNHAGTLSSGCQHGSDSRELLTYLASFCRETPAFLSRRGSSPIKLGQTDGGYRHSPGILTRFSSRFREAPV